MAEQLPPSLLIYFFSVSTFDYVIMLFFFVLPPFSRMSTGDSYSSLVIVESFPSIQTLSVAH